MRIFNGSVLVAGLLLASSGVACGEEGQATQSAAPDSTSSQTAAVDTTRPQQQLIHVARLETPLANDEFTRNASIMQARLNVLASLNARLADATTEEERTTIQSEIDTLVSQMAADNQRMVEAYRYSLTRNYVRDIEQASVYLVLSDEEVEAIRAESAAQGKEAPSSLETNQIAVCTLKTPETARAFQRDVNLVQEQRNTAVQLQARVDAATTDAERAYAQGQLDQMLEQLNTLNQAMVGTYGFSLNRNYVLQIEKSSLYVLADPTDTASQTAEAASNP